MVVKVSETRDPKKIRLQKVKSQWGSKVQLLIAKMLAFKRGLNGAGDRDAHLPVIGINEAFPLQYSVYLDSITDDYKNIVNEAQGILDHQDIFSRKQKLRAISGVIDDSLKVEASWWGSQAWAHFALLGLDKDERLARLRMIAAAKQSRQYLNELELILTRPNEDKIPEACESFINFANLFLGSFVKDLSSLVPSKEVEDITPGMTPENAPVIHTEKPPVINTDGQPLVQTETSAVMNKELPASLKEESVVSPDNKLWKDIIELLSGEVGINFARISTSNLSKKKITEVELRHKQISKAIKNKLNPHIIMRRLNVFNDELKSLVLELDKTASELIGDDVRKVAGKAVERWIRRKLLNMNQSMLNQILSRAVGHIINLDPLFDDMMNSLESKKEMVVDISDKAVKVLEVLKKTSDILLELADNEYRSKKKSKISGKTIKGLRDIGNALTLFTKEFK